MNELETRQERLARHQAMAAIVSANRRKFYRAGRKRQYSVGQFAQTLSTVYAVNVEYDESIAACELGVLMINLRLFLEDQLKDFTDSTSFKFSYQFGTGILRIVKK